MNLAGRGIPWLFALLAALSLAACGGGGHGGDTTTYTYPSESMQPTIAYHEEVTVDLDAYRHAAPAIGDIVAFHPSPGGAVGECGVHHPPMQSCPKATDGIVRSEVFMKRIVAGPGDEVSIRDGLPIVDGKAVLTQVIQECPAHGPEELCRLPKPIAIPPGHYFVMGDHSAASVDSRLWGPIPRAAIFGRAEDK
jgi:signal peptidase I